MYKSFLHKVIAVSSESSSSSLSMNLQQLPRRFSGSTNVPASILLSSCRSMLLSSSSSSSSSLLINNNHSNSHSKRYYHNTPCRSNSNNDRHGTTIVCVRKNGSVCMMGDGMVSQGSMIVKPNALKLRRIVAKTAGMNEKVTTDDTTTNTAASDKYTTIVGFAGSTADAFTLLERLESKLDEYPGQLARSCVELAKGWRTDKYLRRLEASLIVADITCSLEITGNGDVLESHDGVLGVGSGSPYAIAAARALMDIPELSAEDVAKKAMRIASDMCVYTNDNYRIEVLQTGSINHNKEISSSTTTVGESPPADVEPSVKVESKK